MKWPRWSSFRTNWLSDAAKKHVVEVAKAERDAAEMRRLKLSAPDPKAPTAPVKFILSPAVGDEPEKPVTRADLTERRFW